MKYEKILQKINELEYRIKLDEIAIDKAAYNLKFAKRLNLTAKKVAGYEESLEFYNSKIITDKTTLTALKDCYLNPCSFNPSNETEYLFKCTLPYEKVDSNASYQTSIVVSEEVARLFANGVSYKDVISCLENDDIINIESNFTSRIPMEYKKVSDVGVEVIDNYKVAECFDEPIIAKIAGKSTEGVIASSKISTCYPYGKATYRDFNGDKFLPAVPSIDDICGVRKITNAKQNDYNNMVNIEEIVKEKMQKSLDKINSALEKSGANIQL